MVGLDFLGPGVLQRGLGPNPCHSDQQYVFVGYTVNVAFPTEPDIQLALSRVTTHACSIRHGVFGVPTI